MKSDPTKSDPTDIINTPRQFKHIKREVSNAIQLLTNAENYISPIVISDQELFHAVECLLSAQKEIADAIEDTVRILYQGKSI